MPCKFVCIFSMFGKNQFPSEQILWNVLTEFPLYWMPKNHCNSVGNSVASKLQNIPTCQLCVHGHLFVFYWTHLTKRFLASAVSNCCLQWRKKLCVTLYWVIILCGTLLDCEGESCMVSIIELFPSLCLLYLCSDRLAYEKTSVCIIMYGVVYIFQTEASRTNFGIELCSISNE